MVLYQNPVLTLVHQTRQPPTDRLTDFVISRQATGRLNRRTAGSTITKPQNPTTRTLPQVPATVIFRHRRAPKAAFLSLSFRFHFTAAAQASLHRPAPRTRSRATLIPLLRPLDRRNQNRFCFVSAVCQVRTTASAQRKLLHAIRRGHPQPFRLDPQGAYTAPF